MSDRKESIRSQRKQAFQDYCKLNPDQANYDEYLEFMNTTYPELQTYTRNTFITRRRDLLGSKTQKAERHLDEFAHYLQENAIDEVKINNRNMLYKRTYKDYCRSNELKPVAVSTFYNYFKQLPVTVDSVSKLNIPAK